MAVWEILAIGPALCIKLMSHVWPNEKLLIFLFLFGTLAIKAMAFWEILLFPPPKSAISQTHQNNFNNPITTIIWQNIKWVS